MTPDLLFKISGILLTISLFLFVIGRGFKIDSIPLFFVSAKLDKPIGVTGRGATFFGLAAMVLLSSASTFFLAHYKKSHPAYVRSNEPLPLDKHLIRNDDYTVDCETANVTSPSITNKDTIQFWVLDAKTGSGNGFFSSVDIKLPTMTILIESPAEQPQYKRCFNFNLLVKLQWIDNAIAKVFPQTSKCLIDYTLYSDTTISYLNFYGAKVDRYLTLEANSRERSATLLEVSSLPERTIPADFKLTIYQSDPIASKALMDDVTSLLEFCEQGGWSDSGFKPTGVN